jgi:hypothetical protein
MTSDYYYYNSNNTSWQPNLGGNSGTLTIPVINTIQIPSGAGISGAGSGVWQVPAGFQSKDFKYTGHDWAEVKVPMTEDELEQSEAEARWKKYFRI